MARHQERDANGRFTKKGTGVPAGSKKAAPKKAAPKKAAAKKAAPKTSARASDLIPRSVQREISSRRIANFLGGANRGRWEVERRRRRLPKRRV